MYQLELMVCLMLENYPLKTNVIARKHKMIIKCKCVVTRFCLLLCGLYFTGVANAACGPSVISGSASPTVASYDPLVTATQSQNFSLTIQNTGTGNCGVSLIPFSNSGSTTVNLTDGSSNLSYGVSNDNSGTFSNVTIGIPGAVPTSAKSIQLNGISSSVETWYLNTVGGVMTDAGSYTDSDVVIQAYEHLNGNITDFSSGNLSLIDSKTVSAGANVANTCDFPSMPDVTLTNLSNAYSGGFNGTIDLSSAFNSNRATLNTTAIELSYANAVCNWNANLSVRSQNGGLIAQGVSSVSGFKDRVDYQIQAEFCNDSVMVTTAGLANATATTQCTSSTVTNRGLNVTLSTTSSSTPFLKATYEDVITLQLGTTL